MLGGYRFWLSAILVWGCGGSSASPPDGPPACSPVAAHAVTASPATATSLTLAWGGNGYGVAWMDDRDVDKELYFALLGRSGAKMGSDVRLTMSTGTPNIAAMVANGTGYAIIFHDPPTPECTYFTRVDAAGHEIADEIMLGPVPIVAPTLAWNGTEYGAAWSTGTGDLYFLRIDGSGTPVGLPQMITTGRNSQILAASGGRWALLFHDPRDGTMRIYFKLLDGTGQPIGQDVAVSDGVGWAPALVTFGTTYGAIWNDGYMRTTADLHFARLSDAGVKMGAEVPVTSGPDNDGFPSAAAAGSETALVWQVGNATLLFTTLDAAGTPSAPTQVSSTSGGATVVASDQGYGIAWTDTRGGARQVYFASVCRN